MTKKFMRADDGMYHIHGNKFHMLIGSRAQVMHGTAYKTKGNLIKSNLMMNKHGRIVSKRKHATAKREKRLLKAGYGTQKGKFGAVKLHGKSSRRHSKRHGKKRGGSINFALSPSDYDGAGLGTSGNAVQFAAGMGN